MQNGGDDVIQRLLVTMLCKVELGRSADWQSHFKQMILHAWYDPEWFLIREERGAASTKYSYCKCPDPSTILLITSSEK